MFHRTVFQVMVWLQENIPEQSRVSVVHGDFRVDNLIFDAEVTIFELLMIHV